jgi:hypothetical protein
MSATPSAEDVRPAPPLLASTLLDIESEYRKTAKSTEPFQTGVKMLDANLPSSLWTGGKVVGIVSDGGESRVRICIFGTQVSKSHTKLNYPNSLPSN